MTKRVPEIRQRLRKLLHNLKKRCPKGASIYQEWLENLDTFIDDALSCGYEIGLRMVRIDNNGDYAPGNIRFVRPDEQVQSRSNVYLLKVTHTDGSTQTESVNRWSKITDVSRSLFQQSAKTSILHLSEILKRMGREVSTIKAIGEGWPTRQDTRLPEDSYRRLFSDGEVQKRQNPCKLKVTYTDGSTETGSATDWSKTTGYSKSSFRQSVETSTQHLARALAVMGRKVKTVEVVGKWWKGSKDTCPTHDDQHQSSLDKE